MKFTILTSIMVIAPVLCFGMDRNVCPEKDFKSIDKGSWADYLMIQNWKKAYTNPLPTAVDSRIVSSAYHTGQEQDQLLHEADRDIATMLVAGDGLLSEQSCTIL
ncbi:hypothetical protein Noda2021_12740 [Candidatus Dependentiae bacterium Noda2021]|nr:hypothetical protein Noda2021_12740 [Candidatus Dependentiae bacterium Noda2021]